MTTHSDHPSPAEVLAQVAAAQAMLPSYAAQFSALDPGVQARMFRLLDLIGGQSHDGKLESRVLLSNLRHLDGVTLEVSELLAAMDALIGFVDRLATPDPPDSLAQRWLAEYAANHETEQEG